MQNADYDLYNPEQSISHLIRRTHQMTVAGMDSIFMAEGMTGVQWSALMLIHVKCGTTSAAIARNLSHDKGAMTRLIDFLEQRGWIIRERCNDDRRVVNLAVTREGIVVAMRCKQQVEALWREWLGDWDETDIASLVLLLQKLKNTLVSTVQEKDCG